MTTLPPDPLVIGLHAVPSPPVTAATAGTAAAGTDLVSGADRRRLQQARDCLIDCEDALLHVVTHDLSLQPLIDQVVTVLMEVSRRADAATSAPVDREGDA